MSGDAGGANLPYAAKYLKDYITQCSKCNKTPNLEELLLGFREFSPALGQHTDRWYHILCFFPEMKKKGLSVNEAAIRGMSWLKWHDQESIREQIELFNQQPGSSDHSRLYSLSSCRAEHAKSGRGKCGTCRANIKDGEAKYYCKGAHHHLGCFMKGDTMTFVGSIEHIQGYSNLKQEAKDELKAAFDCLVNGKKVKTEVKVEVKTEADMVHSTAAGSSMGDSEMWNIEEREGEAEAAATAADPILAAARKMAQAQKDIPEIVLGIDGAAGAAAGAKSAADAAAKEAAAAAAAAAAIEDDDEIQLLDVVKS
ncbi:hypothetical protein PENTCL1PPCAC_3848, partial [Pristionchus entomophagus]